MEDRVANHRRLIDMERPKKEIATSPIHLPDEAVGALAQLAALQGRTVPEYVVAHLLPVLQDQLRALACSKRFASGVVKHS
jgi:hypothetical protein